MSRLNSTGSPANVECGTSAMMSARRQGRIMGEGPRSHRGFGGGKRPGRLRGRRAFGFDAGEGGAVGSDVAERHGLAEACQRISGGDELLPNISIIADLDKGLHDRPVGDLLLLVQLATARVAGGVDVPDRVSELANPPD